jgi:ferredoxin
VKSKWSEAACRPDVRGSSVKRRITLHIPSELVSKPIISELVKEFDITFNILRAQVMEDEEGMLTVEFSGAKSNVDNAIGSLQERGVRVRELSRDIKRDEDRCTDCGVCVGQCPTGALSVHDETYEIDFDARKCILCELCVPACVFGAMKVTHEVD